MWVTFQLWARKADGRGYYKDLSDQPWLHPPERGVPAELSPGHGLWNHNLSEPVILGVDMVVRLLLPDEEGQPSGWYLIQRASGGLVLFDRRHGGTERTDGSTRKRARRVPR